MSGLMRLTGCNRLLWACVVGLAGMLLFSGVSFGSVERSWYVAEVLVPVGRFDDREARAQGLSRVLVRLTGTPAILKHKKVRAALPKAENYLEQFGFGHTAKTLPPVEEGGEPRPGRILRLHFSPELVDQLIAEADASVWEAPRPGVIGWVATDASGDTEILGAAADSVLVEALGEQAQEKGISLLLPLMDMEDTIRVSPWDVWSLNGGGVVNASGRYRAEAVLSARVSARPDDSWDVSWRLQYQDQENVRNLQVQTEAQAATEIVASVSQWLAGWSAVNTWGSASRLVLEIEGVTALEAYARVSALLSDLPGTESIRLSRVSPNQLRYIATVNDRGDALRQAMGRQNNKLTFLGERYGDAEGMVLRYQWLN